MFALGDTKNTTQKYTKNIFLMIDPTVVVILETKKFFFFKIIDKTLQNLDDHKCCLCRQKVGLGDELNDLRTFPYETQKVKSTRYAMHTRFRSIIVKSPAVQLNLISNYFFD